MTKNKLKQITELYVDYIRKPYEEKLHYGDLLWQAGCELLKLDKISIELNDQLNKGYFMRKIAGDLIRQVENM